MGRRVALPRGSLLTRGFDARSSLHNVHSSIASIPVLRCQSFVTLIAVEGRGVKQDLILKLVLIGATLMGIFFRFYHLDTKAYWFDETFTSLRISGFTDKELVEGIRANGGLVSASDLRKYQTVQPGRTVVDTVRGLASEEPQNPPLYFAAARLWADVAGSSISATRLLPALLSLLVLPLTYWLCRELFASAFIGWMAVAIVSLSPLHVLFAQTARPQSLWTVTILLSSSALLWALRTSSIIAWGIYTLSLIISLYTFILSGLFIAGFGLYVLAMAGFRLTRSVFAFAISSALAMLAFTPWVVVLLFGRNNVAATTNWRNSKLSLFELVRAWVMGVVRLFFDINNQSGDTPAQLSPVFIVLPLLSVLVGCSLYFVWKNAPRRASLFILCLIGSSFLPLALADLVNGGTRISAAQRYLIPAYLGLQLSVASMLARAMLDNPTGTPRTIWRGLILLIFLLGGVSCWISSLSETWWTKDPDGANPEIARLINKSASPLIFSDGWMGHVLSLSVGLKENVKLKIEPLCYVCGGFDLSRDKPVVPEGFTDVFYFHPGWEPPSYLPAFAKSTEYGMQASVLQRGRTALWKVERRAGS
jgi:uncharacterized membrane protein